VAAPSGSSDPRDVALARLLSVMDESLRERARLRHALASRVVVEQAKGILAERLRTTPERAFELLRQAARHDGVRVHELAREVIVSKETPKRIVAELERGAAAC